MNNTFTSANSKSKINQIVVLILSIFIFFNTAKAQVYCNPSFFKVQLVLYHLISTFLLSFASFSGTTFCSGVPCSTNYGDYFTTYTANLTEGTPSALTVNYNNSSDPTLFGFDIFAVPGLIGIMTVLLMMPLKE
jgi:hypothetical protein